MHEDCAGRALTDERVEVISNEQVAPSIHQIELLAPKIASQVQPGQFIHLEVPNFAGHVLRRPFSVYQWDAERKTITVMYQVVGAGSERLTQAKWGDASMAIGPVGRGWSPAEGTRRALLRIEQLTRILRDGLDHRDKVERVVFAFGIEQFERRQQEGR